MSDIHRKRAQQVVQSFKELLDRPVIEAIPANAYEQLELFIEQALADEQHDAAEQLEALARRLRAGASLADEGQGIDVL